MNCNETRKLLNAYVDGELDSAGCLSIESHVQQCASCRRSLESLRSLGSAIENGALRFQAPGHLRRNVQTAIRAANPGARSPLFAWRWAGALASVMLVIGLAWIVTTQSAKSSDESQLVNDILSSHVRSMMANHITDVASSDSHTVKPWFGGKLDFSPPAKDLTEQGYRLIGGRLDYLDNRPVAALVYQHSQHYINLFVWPLKANAISSERQLSRQGYNVIHWTQSGMSYWLVSELNSTELNECARLLKEK
jgi:anti-sigma factor RsiW